MRPIVLASITAGLGLLLQACAGGQTADVDPATDIAASTTATPSEAAASGAADELHTVTGQLAVYDGEAFPAHHGKCTGGSAGYDDLSVGSQVTLKDQADEIVGVGSFLTGSLDGRGGCILSFSIPDARPAEFYQLVSASLQRAPRTVSREQLLADGWRLELQVGDEREAVIESGAYCMSPTDFSVEPLGATVGPVTVGRYGVPKGPVDGRINVTSTADRDADVHVYWQADVWSALLGEYSMVALGYDWVSVTTDGTATHEIHLANAGVLLGGMDADYSRVRLTAKVESAREAGQQAMCD